MVELLGGVRYAALALFLAGTFLATPAAAASAVHKLAPAAADLETIRAVFAAPESAIDLARAKLTLDKLVDPSIDIDKSLRQIGQMTQVAKAMAGPNPSEIQKLAAVRRFIYVDGDWNGHKPFHYDMADPLGKKIANKLLPTYIETRSGNCVSMPMLFVILATPLGVHATISTAPFHVFVKFVDDATGKTYNLETTSGGYPERDAWLRSGFPMTDLAIKNGVYMKTLTKKEAVAVMAGVVLEYYLAAQRYHDVIDAAGIILEYYPNDVPAILDHADAAARLIDTEFKQKYPNPRDIPADLLPTYILLADQNHEDFAKAEALGWRETDGITPDSKGGGQ
jgi:hypothetical protein